MRMLWIVVGIGLMISTAAFIIYFSTTASPVSSPSTKPDEPTQDAKASFAIFTHGTLRVFTDPKYHNQSAHVYLTSNTPNILTVSKKGVTWDDFFKTLPMTLTKECLLTGTGQQFCTNEAYTLRFYLNGLMDTDALDHLITHGDQLLVSYGSENEDVIMSQLQQVPAVKEGR